jgi:sugar phosphate isomerase/epimerase
MIVFHSLSSTAADKPSAFPSSLYSADHELSRPTRPRSTGRTALAISQMSTYRQSFVEDVLGCQAAGIGRIGIWRRKLEDFGLERAIEVLRDHQVSVSSVSWGGGFTGASGLTFDEALDDTRTAIYQAARLRAHALTIVSGGRAGHIHSHARRLLIDGLAATVEIAAEHGITLALQPMAAEYSREWTFLDSLEEALEIVRTFDHPFLGLAVGTSHMWQQEAILERLEVAAPHVATVQVSDWTLERDDVGRRLPGEGIIPLKPMVWALQRGGYQGDFEIDVWSADVWKIDPAVWLAGCADVCRDMIFAARSPVVR